MPAPAPDEPSDPRTQAGPNPQHLLATVLGEYLDSAEADLPAAAVVAILAEFGITQASARATLSRLTKRGLIARREGRRPLVYHLTPEALARHHDHMERFLTFGSRPPVWTGQWLAVSFSLPEAQQAQRHAIRKLLSSLGFVRLYDSLWIRPGDDADPVATALADLLDGTDARWSLLHTRFHEEAGAHGPASGHDLTGLAARYRAFIERYGGLRAAIHQGNLTPAAALVARTSIMDSWRRFPDLDPDLPAHLLPDPWPRETARELLLEVHAALGEPAAARLVEITEPHWPVARTWITYFRAGPDGRPVRAG